MELGELENLPFYFHDLGSQLRDHVFRRSRACFARGDAARDQIHTVGQLRQRQLALREFFLETIGGLPPRDSPLSPRQTGVLEYDSHTVEKIIFHSRPDTPVPANLYLPRTLSAPTGAVLFLCGHDREAKHCDEYQRVCLTLVQAGLIVLAIDPIGQGERFSYHEPQLNAETVRWGVREHDHAGAQCLLLGDNVARYFLHDAIRALDYLCSRPEVDPHRIGVTGNSGGGTQTAMLMMVDDRIQAAAPATFIMSREAFLPTGQAQDAEQIWFGFSQAGFDHEDLLLAMAPRAVCVLAATWDCFPVQGTRHTVERCRRFWEMTHAPSAFRYFEDCSLHLYTEAMARAAADFFRLHLLGLPPVETWQEVHPVPPPDLWCTTSGQVRGDTTSVRAVFEENCDRLATAETQYPKNTAALSWLRSRINDSRESCALDPCRYNQVGVGELSADLWFWHAQPDLLNTGFLFRSAASADHALPVTLAVWEGGTRQLNTHADWLRDTCSSGRAVLVLNPSGVGLSTPHPITADGISARDFYGTMHVLSDDLLWLGDSLAALRAFDVLRAVAFLDHLACPDIQLYTPDRDGWPARLAALLEPRIATITGPPIVCKKLAQSRHYPTRGVKEVILPGLLRHFDL